MGIIHGLKLFSFSKTFISFPIQITAMGFEMSQVQILIFWFHVARISKILNALALMPFDWIRPISKLLKQISN